MDNIIEFKEWFIKNFNAFEESLNGENTPLLHRVRKEAFKNFNELSFPTVKDEEWRFTNISPLLKYNFTLPSEDFKISDELVNKFLLNEIESNILIFVNGKFSEKNSKLLNLPEGTIVGSISDAMKNNPEIIDKYFGKYASYSNQIFTALSTAFTKDGAFVYVPDSKIVEDPIHIIFITTASEKKIIIQPRNLFIASKNSQVTIIEHFVSENDNIYFTNAVTEIVAEENAIIDHYKLQEESKNAFHIARVEIDQKRSSNFTSHSISTGGVITRNDINAHFNGEGGECTLNGLFLLEDKQLFDAHTLIDHATPLCNSHEHYKGILDDSSRGVFNGKVLVRQDAQKTNAFQKNNNILLSNNALVNTKPQLEIFADDVKCSHGATIGQIDEEAKFYLKSRGIGEKAANAILIHAFASDVIKSMKIDSVRNYLEDILSKRFNQ
ncbi:MAG: Fe-S cluster assembly protein SufD [Bacteroidetes bacterium]|nr:Fe-S cluster assembly protein SufD [Bacteroidota bacterium]